MLSPAHGYQFSEEFWKAEDATGSVERNVAGRGSSRRAAHANMPLHSDENTL